MAFPPVLLALGAALSGFAAGLALAARRWRRSQLDIDVLRRTEAHLWASQESLANAQRIARMGDWEWTVASDALVFSSPVAALLGVSAARLPRTCQAALAQLDPANAARFGQRLVAALADGQPFDFDADLSPVFGRPMFLAVRGEVWRDEAGAAIGVRGTLQEVTERKQIELALRESKDLLRQLSARQEALLEEERKRISREVHDELGQRLTSLKMDLSLLRLHFGETPGLQAWLDKMRGRVDEAIAVTRDIATALRPAALDLGLVPALEWLVEHLEARSSLCITLQVSGGEVALPAPLETVIFRVVQEALTNIARHAQAQEARIELRRAVDRLALAIVDDGIGLDPAEPPAPGGLGLLGMRERVSEAGGTFRLETRPGAGTRIAIEFPLTAGRPDA